MPAQYDIWAAVRRGLVYGTIIGAVWMGTLALSMWVCP
jgi:hypothetical protein